MKLQSLPLLLLLLCFFVFALTVAQLQDDDIDNFEIKDYEPTADEDDNPNNPFILTTITNEFEFPVNLYWVEPVSKKRELMQELLGEELDMRVIPGHVFEVCKTTTGEVVHTFQVLSNAKNSYGEVEIEVGPKKQNPEDFVEIKEGDIAEEEEL